MSLSFNVYSALGLKKIIIDNQNQTVAARQANIDRQNELKGYVKCIMLLRYNVPLDQLTTKQGAEKALDDCADQSAPLP